MFKAIYLPLEERTNLPRRGLEFELSRLKADGGNVATISPDFMFIKYIIPLGSVTAARWKLLRKTRSTLKSKLRT